MASQSGEDLERFYRRALSVRLQTRATYDTLLRQSRKLGNQAVRSLADAGQGTRRILGQQPIANRADGINELKEVVAHSQEVIASAKTVLPLIFPHEIILDRTKIIIIKRIFFWSSDVISIRVEDVLNISASVGPLFGSVTIASRVMSTVDHFIVERFWRSDAIRMEKIIQGYLIARHNGVPTDHLSCNELAQTLDEIAPTRS